VTNETRATSALTDRITGSLWAYCKNVGATGLPTAALMAGSIEFIVRDELASAWDQAIEEAEGRGHLHDAAAAEMLGRNPYRSTQ
jgi:hypothetical protein